MRFEQFIFTVGLFLPTSLLAQTNHSESPKFPFLNLESQTNIEVLATWKHPLSCSPKDTNLISNTNLVSISEQKLFEELSAKYHNITTNAGPASASFQGIKMRQWDLGKFKKIFPVYCYNYTNSVAKEEVAFSEREFIASFRTAQGDGYDVKFIDGSLNQYQEYKNGVLDGLCVILDGDHCHDWTRFEKGKIVGRFISWDQDGLIRLEAEFKEPFDFLKNETLKFDLAWTEIPEGATNSVQH